jgi:hypothetical protein
VNELLDGRLVGSVVARRPERVSFIKRSVIENLLMYGTGRNENEAFRTGSPSCLDQHQSADHILLDELDHVTFGTAKPRSRSVESCVNYSVAAICQRGGIIGITQVSHKPLQIADFVEAVTIAGCPVPTSELVSLLSQMIGDVTAYKSGGSR